MASFDAVVSWVRQEPGSLPYVLLPVVDFFRIGWGLTLIYVFPSWLRFTQFVNLASGSNLNVGDELESCTNAVQSGRPFDLGGRRVVLVDTPGFDDTVRSDVDVLNMIAAFLATS